MAVWIEPKKILQLFDEPPEDLRGHLSPIISMVGEELACELFCQYWRGHGYQMEVLPFPVTTGKKTGYRLDRWIVMSKGRRCSLLQVEIKSWAAHAIGGKVLELHASNSVLKAYRINRWNLYFDSGNSKFKMANCQKVTEKMKSPTGYEHLPIESCIIFWQALHPKGLKHPHFMTPVSSKAFKEVRVFSISNYLRSLDLNKKIRLELTHALKRIYILKQYFILN